MLLVLIIVIIASRDPLFSICVRAMWCTYVTPPIFELYINVCPMPPIQFHLRRASLQNPSITSYASSVLRNRYRTQRPNITADVKYLSPFGPPNSPPTALHRRTIMMVNAMMAPLRNMVTEKAKLYVHATDYLYNIYASHVSQSLFLLSRIDFEITTMIRMIEGGNRPGQSDAQKHVHRIAAGHIANAGICVLVLNGGHFAGERIWGTSRNTHNYKDT